MCGSGQCLYADVGAGADGDGWRDCCYKGRSDGLARMGRGQLKSQSHEGTRKAEDEQEVSEMQETNSTSIHVLLGTMYGS